MPAKSKAQRKRKHGEPMTMTRWMKSGVYEWVAGVKEVLKKFPHYVPMEWSDVCDKRG